MWHKPYVILCVTMIYRAVLGAKSLQYYCHTPLNRKPYNLHSVFANISNAPPPSQAHIAFTSQSVLVLFCCMVMMQKVHRYALIALYTKLTALDATAFASTSPANDSFRRTPPCLATRVYGKVQSTLLSLQEQSIVALLLTYRSESQYGCFCLPSSDQRHR